MTHRRLVVIVVFAAIFSFDLAQSTDIDFWWHLRTGELIATTGAIPATDPFSYTAAGRPWVAHEWLWELMVFLIYEHAGWAVAVLLSAAIVTLAYAVLYRLLRQVGANEILSAALVLWAALLAAPNFGVRPREVTYLLFTFYLSRLFLYRDGRIRHLWVLPPLMVAWVNLHGGFVLGLGLLGLFAIAGVLHWLIWKDPFPRHLMTVTLLVIFAACVNPAGPRLLLYPLGYYMEGENPSFSIVSEFMSPNFHQLLYLLFSGGIVLLMLIGVRRDRSSLVDALVVAVFALQALVSVRQVGICALVMAPVLASSLCERFSWARDRPMRPPTRVFAAVNWVVLVMLILGAGVRLAQPNVWDHLQLVNAPQPSAVPVAGAQFIEDRQLPEPIFNHQPWGGYLIYRWYPHRRVFIDGRIDMYGPEITSDYMNAIGLLPGGPQVLDKYGIQTALLPKDSPLSFLLAADERWERVFQGEIEDVFVRRSGA